MAEYEKYFAIARDLKVFSSLKTQTQKRNLFNMNNYELGVFAIAMREYLGIVAIQTPNFRLSPKQSIKKAYNQASNILDSVVGGLNTKYISKEMARQEITVAAQIIGQIEKYLMTKAKELKAEQIIDVKMQASSFQSLDSLADLDKYITGIVPKSVDQKMESIIHKYSGKSPNINNVFPKPKPVVEDDHIEANPYASPSRYNEYLGDFTKKYHDAFDKASKQIKIPNTIGPNAADGQSLYQVCRLPIYVISQPALKPAELQKYGIKFSALDKNSFILYNQIVLAVWSKQDLTDYNKTVERAKSALKLQFNADYLYSKPFTSKELGKPIAFYWVVPVSTKLSPFTIKTIGLPFTPELKKVEDLSNDISKIRQANEAETNEKMDRTRLVMELVQPLFDQYQDIKNQIADIRKKVTQSYKDLKDLNDALMAKKVAMQMLKPGSKEFKQAQIEVIGLESKIALRKDDLINERTVRSIGLAQKKDKLLKEIQDFTKAGG